MLYLIGQMVGFLLAAAVLGLFAGWVIWGRPAGEHRGPKHAVPRHSSAPVLLVNDVATGDVRTLPRPGRAASRRGDAAPGRPGDDRKDGADEGTSGDAVAEGSTGDVEAAGPSVDIAPATRSDGGPADESEPETVPDAETLASGGNEPGAEAGPVTADEPAARREAVARDDAGSADPGTVTADEPAARREAVGGDDAGSADPGTESGPGAEAVPVAAAEPATAGGGETATAVGPEETGPPEPRRPAAVETAVGPDGTASGSDAPTDDDLRQIAGVGPATARALVAAGITTYRQVAGLPRDGAALDRVRAELTAFSGRIRVEPEKWGQHARDLHLRKYGEPL